MIDFKEDKKKGITEAISNKLPSEEEEKSNDCLLDLLNEVSPEQNKETRLKQETVLAEIYDLYQSWLQLTTENNPDSAVHTEILDVPLIYTYGSFRLGVQEQGGDIDTLLIGPKRISHSMFFDEFCDGILKKSPKTKKYTTVRNSFVPLCKMEFDGVDIDLIFAQVAINKIDGDFDIHNDEVMHGVSLQTIRSLNGVRVTDMLIDLVPDIKVFKQCVRFVKIWAKRRGIYGNSIGYLGGVSYTIMVARICQLYPNANSAVILRQFFIIYDAWHWPTPVCLNKIKSDGPGDHTVWSRESDLYDRMPIITPAYPAQNSTYNVTFSNFTFLKAEIERVKDLFQTSKGEIYREIIKQNTFFGDFKHYFQITALCGEDQSSVWFGWVESRIRKFVSALEEMLCFQLVPFPEVFRHDESGEKKAMSLFIGSKIIVDRNEIATRKNKKGRQINVSPVVKDFVDHLRSYKQLSDGMDVKIGYIPRAKIPFFVHKAGIELKKRKLEH